MKRLFDGDALPLMEHLISDSGLTPAESDNARRLEEIMKKLLPLVRVARYPRAARLLLCDGAAVGGRRGQVALR